MKVAIHQPNFMPWTGFFNKLSKVDTYVILSRVQYSKGEVTNRVNIKTPNGAEWLTVPIAGKRDRYIRQVELSNWMFHRKKILRTIEQNYKKAPNFDLIYPEFVLMFNKEHNLR